MKRLPLLLLILLPVVASSISVTQDDYIFFTDFINSITVYALEIFENLVNNSSIKPLY